MADLKTYRPSHVTAVGSPGPHARVLFREGLYIELDEFAQEHLDREYGGVLLGIRRRPEGSQYDEILINGFIPFPQRYHLRRLSLGVAEMAEMHMKQEAHYPELQIVGWIHTHPGFGTFLSQNDRQQHMEFFPEPWQIALVVDPQNMARGLYQFMDGEPQQLSGYYLAELPPARAVLKRSGGSGRRSRRRKVNYPRFAVAVLVLLFIMTGVGYGGLMLWDYLQLPNASSSNNGDGRSANTAQPTAPAPPPAEELARPVTPSPQPAPTQPTPAGNQGESVAEEPATEQQEVLASNEYVVQPGDNLWAISASELGDGSRFREILELNNLNENTVLQVGMVLRIPESE